MKADLQLAVPGMATVSARCPDDWSDFKYHNTIVAVDGSGSSKRALDEAVRIAAFTHGQAHEFYLVEKAPVFPYTYHYDMFTMNHNLRHQGLAMLNEAAQAMALVGGNGDTEVVETNSMTDDIADCLQRRTHNYGADLVVTGTHGYRGLRRVVLGSVAEIFVHAAAYVGRHGQLLVREPDGHHSPSASSGGDRGRVGQRRPPNLCGSVAPQRHRSGHDPSIARLEQPASRQAHRGQRSGAPRRDCRARNLNFAGSFLALPVDA
jgi:nucleotide-binding universal stress UspA family protein